MEIGGERIEEGTEQKKAQAKGIWLGMVVIGRISEYGCVVSFLLCI